MMTKQDRLVNREYAAVVNELIAEGLVDISPDAILRRYLKAAIDDGRSIPSLWAVEVQGRLLYIRRLVERDYRQNIVALNLKFFKRRSKTPPESLQEACEYVRFSTNLLPVALHVVKNCETDYLWSAWIVDRKHRNSGAAANLVNHVDQQIENGQLKEETAVSLMEKHNPRIRIRNQALLNVLAASMTGPEQIKLELDAPLEEEDRLLDSDLDGEDDENDEEMLD